MIPAAHSEPGTPRRRDWLLCFTRPELVFWDKPIAVTHVPASPHDSVISAVCKHLDISKELLMSKRQGVRVSYARHLAFYVLHSRPSYSYPLIGRIFGRDHTSVMHGDRRIAKALHAGDERVMADVAMFRGFMGSLPTQERA